MAVASGRAVVRTSKLSRLRKWLPIVHQGVNFIDNSVVLGFSVILVYSMHSHSLLERKPVLAAASAHIYSVPRFQCQEFPSFLIL